MADSEKQANFLKGRNTVFACTQLVDIISLDSVRSLISNDYFNLENAFD